MQVINYHNPYKIALSHEELRILIAALRSHAFLSPTPDADDTRLLTQLVELQQAGDTEVSQCDKCEGYINSITERLAELEQQVAATCENHTAQDVCIGNIELRLDGLNTELKQKFQELAAEVEVVRPCTTPNLCQSGECVAASNDEMWVYDGADY